MGPGRTGQQRRGLAAEVGVEQRAGVGVGDRHRAGAVDRPQERQLIGILGQGVLIAQESEWCAQPVVRSSAIVV
jgi:hypothetical protein